MGSDCSKLRGWSRKEDLGLKELLQELRRRRRDRLFQDLCLGCGQPTGLTGANIEGTEELSIPPSKTGVTMEFGNKRAEWTRE